MLGSNMLMNCRSCAIISFRILIRLHVLSFHVISFHRSQFHLIPFHVVSSQRSSPSHLIPAHLMPSLLFAVHLSFSRLITAHQNSSLFSPSQCPHSSQFVFALLRLASAPFFRLISSLLLMPLYYFSESLLFFFQLTSSFGIDFFFPYMFTIADIPSNLFPFPTRHRSSFFMLFLCGQQKFKWKLIACAVHNDARSQSSAATMASSRRFRMACKLSILRLVTRRRCENEAFP